MITDHDIRSVPLFAELDAEQVRRLASRAAEIRVAADAWIVREGEAGAFYALLDGHVEIVKLVGGREMSLAKRVAGDYFGEVPLMLSAPYMASFKALAPSRLLRLSRTDFNMLISTSPSVREVLGKALLDRVGGVGEAVATAERVPVVLGGALDIQCHDLRDFLERNFVEFEWLDPHDERDRSCIPAAALTQSSFPALLLADGTMLARPSLRRAAEALGLRTVPSVDAYDVVIIGGGPSGLSAAVYGASEGLHTLMVEGTAPGGQAGTSSRIENYLGFPIGLSGEELGSRALMQAKRFGAEIVVTRKVCSIEPGDGMHAVTLEDGVSIRARAIVLASGVTYRALDVPDLVRFVGAGVYYGAARSEALYTRGRDIYLIGGGNSAGQAAMFFASYAARVTLLVRGPSLAASMSQYLIDQLATRDNVVTLTNAEMVGVTGRHHLEGIVVRDRVRDEKQQVPADAVFIFIGADANTDWLPEELARDERGYILTGRDIGDAGTARTIGRDPFLLETSIPGIFAAGDVRHGSLKRVASSVGEGSMAIAFIHQYLAKG